MSKYRWAIPLSSAVMILALGAGLGACAKSDKMSDWERLERAVDALRTSEHESGDKPLCEDGYFPESFLEPEGARRIESFRPVPLGVMTYESSEFFIERDLDGYRSQLHVSHPAGEENAHVVCTARHALSGQIRWQSSFPSRITSLRGARAEYAYRPVSAEVNTREYGWRYQFGVSGEGNARAIDLSDGNTWLYLLPDGRYQLILHEEREDGAAVWISVVYSFTRSRRGPARPPLGEGDPIPAGGNPSSGGNSAPTATPQPAGGNPPSSGGTAAPAPSGRLDFGTLPLGRYSFVSATIYSNATIQGERIELNLVDPAGEDNARVIAESGLESGLGYYANLGMVSEFDKTGPTSGTFTFSSYYVRVEHGGYNYQASGEGTVTRTSVRNFGSLGLSHYRVDAGSEPGRYILTRFGDSGGVSIQVRVVVQHEGPAQ